MPPFTAALQRGVLGLALSLTTEVVLLLAVGTAANGTLTPAEGADIFTWVVTGIGLGLIGAFVHSSSGHRSDPLAPYRDAQQLIRELTDISRRPVLGARPLHPGRLDRRYRPRRAPADGRVGARPSRATS